MTLIPLITCGPQFNYVIYEYQRKSSLTRRKIQVMKRHNECYLLCIKVHNIENAAHSLQVFAKAGGPQATDMPLNAGCAFSLAIAQCYAVSDVLGKKSKLTSELLTSTSPINPFSQCSQALQTYSNTQSSLFLLW